VGVIINTYEEKLYDWRVNMLKGIKLRDYQQTILNETKHLPAIGLFMKTGSGKTLTALERYMMNGTPHLLVVCPQKIVTQWIDVIEKHTDLKPCKYKYNHGTSNRFHTGFIAQEVVEALEIANLTTQDFAAVMKQEPDNNGCEWLLRRDEFVALNTWQIQKLKSRISELENEILKIKGEKGLC
jgi:superfamily II DNA or RNA helicase